MSRPRCTATANPAERSRRRLSPFQPQPPTANPQSLIPSPYHDQHALPARASRNARREQHGGARGVLHGAAPARTAEFMEGLTAQEAWAVLRHAEMAVRVEIFGFFEEEKQIEIVETIDRDEIARFIGEMPPGRSRRLARRGRARNRRAVDAAGPGDRAARHHAAERLSGGHGRRRDDHRVRPAQRRAHRGVRPSRKSAARPRRWRPSTICTWSTARTIFAG